MTKNQVDLNFPKGGVFLIMVAVIGIFLFSKSTVTIGPGEGGVIFESLGSGIDTEKPMVKDFTLCCLGIK